MRSRPPPANVSPAEAAGPAASPCVRNCCLDDAQICLGCHRSLAEILAWGDADGERRREILENCRLRRERCRAKGWGMF